MHASQDKARLGPLKSPGKLLCPVSALQQVLHYGLGFRIGGAGTQGLPLNKLSVLSIEPQSPARHPKPQTSLPNLKAVDSTETLLAQQEDYKAVRHRSRTTVDIY